MLQNEHTLEDGEMSETCTALVGAKAMGLYHLSRAGFNVPRFFVLTCQAWTKFCAPLLVQFQPQLAAILDLSDLELFNLSSNIQKLILELNFENPITSEITSKLASYGFLEVAVRSSAIAEDLAERSFAGIYESFLNVDPQDTLSRVKKCWASAFSLRAFAYMKEDKDVESFAMAVVIQEMTHFDLSGVIFTLDPVAQRHILIEVAALPTPERIVSGTISPSRFLFDRHFDLVEKSTLEPIPISTIRDVARLALEIEHALGSPQDIEFGMRGSMVTCLQSRPITTLKQDQRLEDTTV